MREPALLYRDGKFVPFSQVSTAHLRDYLVNEYERVPDGNPPNDHYSRDFRRQYAAILLKERGQ